MGLWALPKRGRDDCLRVEYAGCIFKRVGRELEGERVVEHVGMNLQFDLPCLANARLFA